ncbi:MAG: hypothetical protein N3F07_02870 [Candidatus Micrarchaeota archaeon]|nr:hypothetical protein [Candidatus Micrarchaeota archaeon]
MAQASAEDIPFSARYSLPAQVADSLGEVSWETVAQLSKEFTVSAEEKSSKVKKIIKELQMTRLLLLDKIRHASKEGKIDPKLLVDVVKLLRKCEEVAKDYELDLRDFASFLYLIAEKLKKEKLAHHKGHACLRLSTLVPIKEELQAYKAKSEAHAKRRKKG